MITRSTLTRRAAVGGIALLALAACGSDDDAETIEDPAAEAPAEDEGESDPSDGGGEPAEEESGEDEDEPAGGGESGAEVEIGETFTDEETGDEITVVSALRDMPTEQDSIYVEEGGEVIYLQVELTAGEQFGGTISGNDFSILYGDDEGSAKGTLRDEIEAAGYEPLEYLSRRDGESGPVWVALTVEGDRQDSYTAAYTRPEAKVLGEDTTIPEFRHEFEIPAP